MSNVEITHILHSFLYPYAASFETWSETPPTIWEPPVYLAVESTQMTGWQNDVEGYMMS